MENYWQKKVTKLDIQAFIDNKADESNYLEFKSADSLFPSDKNKKEISKDVSAFANADGGLIIYGIAENDDHKADLLSLIGKDKISFDSLQQIIDSRIQRKIDGILIEPIDYGENLYIYLVRIPLSPNAPHQSADKRFYVRRNSQAVMMEEYEIRNTYNRVVKTSLRICQPKITFNPSYRLPDKLENCIVHLELEIENIGSNMEKYYKIEVTLPWGAMAHTGFSFNAALQKAHMRDEGRKSIYFFPSETEIYPEERQTICKIMINVVKQNIIDLTEIDIKIRLFYSSDNTSLEFNLIEGIPIKAKKITEADFY